MNTLAIPAFDQADALAYIDTLNVDELDELPFGVIGFDRNGMVLRYNAHESRLAGLSRERVLATPLFTAVAPCMNNYLVAQRFEDAARDGAALDATIDYVLTLRMRPSRVKLRLLFSPAASLAYVFVSRPT